MKRIALIVTTVAALAISASAPAATIADNFNNNSINAQLWNKDKVGGVNVSEKNQRLQISANGNTNQSSYAFLESDGWGIDWRQNFTLTMNYKLELAPPDYPRMAGVGLALSFAPVPNNFSNFNGLTIGIERGEFGLYLSWYFYEDGQAIDWDRQDIQDTTGKLIVKWNKGADRLTIEADGVQTFPVEGLYEDYGQQFGAQPLLVAIGGRTEMGDMAFGGGSAWLDNFKLIGTFHGQ